MISMKNLLRNDRVCKALTGLTVCEVENLLVIFERCLVEYHSSKPNRQRAVGAGRKGVLPTALDKLVFILIYVKVYPTFDVMGVMYGRARSKCCESVKWLLPLLEKALGYRCALPKRKITSVSDFYTCFPGIQDIFIDGTERRVQRPQKPSAQRKMYSGKKKAHTRKNMVISDENRRILLMVPTKSGRRHDKRLADKSGLPAVIPQNVTLWTDTGFQGWQEDHPNVMMPTKATKHHPLTPEQKSENRVVSALRVVVEHAIGGYKRFRAASDIYRNRRTNFDDQLNIVSAGLWNYHLDMAA